MTDKSYSSEADLHVYNAAVSRADAYVICASAVNPSALISISSWHKYIYEVLE